MEKHFYNVHIIDNIGNTLRTIFLIQQHIEKIHHCINYEFKVSYKCVEIQIVIVTSFSAANAAIHSVPP